MFDKIYRQVVEKGISFDLSSEIFVNSWLVSDPLTIDYRAFTNFEYSDGEKCLPIIFAPRFETGQLGWEPYREETTALTHLRQINDDNQMIYAAVDIVAPSETTVLVNLYNKKNIKIWQNDRLVFCGRSDAKCLDESFILRLDKGDNFLLIEKNTLSISLKIREYWRELEVRKRYLSAEWLKKYETGIGIVTDRHVYENNRLLLMAVPKNLPLLSERAVRIELSGPEDRLLFALDTRFCVKVEATIDQSVRGRLKIRAVSENGKALGETEVYCGKLNEDLARLKSRLESISCNLQVKNDLLAQIEEAHDIFNLQESAAYERRMMFDEEIITVLLHMKSLKDTVAALESGTYDHVARRGLVVNSYPSRLDDRCRHYYAFVPSNYDPGRKYPVLVMLKYLYKKIQIPGFALGFRDSSPDFITLSPAGRGMTRYEVAGEIDVLEALTDLAERYSIDRDSIYLIGFSMGGGACWNLAQKHPSTFRGIITLSSNLNSGYNCNLSNTRIHNIVGELDRMVEGEKNHLDICEFRDRSGACDVRSMVLPDTNHFALYNVYNDLKMFDWMSGWKQSSVSADKLHFRTDNLMHNRSHWISVTDVERPSIDSEIEASVYGDTIWLKTKNISEVEIDPYFARECGIRLLAVNGCVMGLPRNPVTSLVVRDVGTSRPHLSFVPSRTEASNTCGLGIAEIYYGKASVVVSPQKEEGKGKFIRKMASSFSRPIYYADYREKYCDIPVYGADNVPTAALRENIVVLGGTEDNLLYDIRSSEIAGRVLRTLDEEVSAHRVMGMTIKFPNPWAPAKRMVLVTLDDIEGMSRYKNEDIMKAKFDPPFSGRKGLMRHDAVLFTESGIRAVNFTREWRVAEIFSL